VKGLLVVTVILFAPLIGNPTNGETENTKILSGDKGSTFGSISLNKIYNPKAEPPGYKLYISPGITFFSIFLLVKSISRIFASGKTILSSFQLYSNPLTTILSTKPFSRKLYTRVQRASTPKVKILSSKSYL